MPQIRAKIILNKKFRGNYWHCVVHAVSIAGKSNPGQFLNVRISDGLKPFLRRPFSIHNINGSNLEILYEVIGEGTLLLSKKKAGDSLDIIGPLGNGFNYRLPITDYRLPILIGGGIGIAPLLFLSNKIKAKNKIALIGARASSQVLCEKEFKNAGCDVKIATDDGSLGFKGKVTGLLKFLLTTNDQRPTTIYACGPRPMLKAVCNIALRNNIPAQVSLEEHMSCGIGACLGCVVKTRNGLERVCKEGPVFNAEDIIWE